MCHCGIVAILTCETTLRNMWVNVHMKDGGDLNGVLVSGEG